MNYCRQEMAISLNSALFRCYFSINAVYIFEYILNAPIKLFSEQVGFNDAGAIELANIQLYSDAGHVANDNSVDVAKSAIANVYDWTKIQTTSKVVTTDTAANTWCRTPGE